MAKEDANSAVLDEAQVNAAAAKEVEQSQKDAAAQAASDTGKGTQDAGKTSTDNKPANEQTFDAQKRYEDLDKRYKDLQREFTPLSQERARSSKELEELRKQVKQFQEALAVVTEKPIDIEQFKRDFDTHGPKALESHVQKLIDRELKKVREDYDARIAKSDEKYNGVYMSQQVLLRANDSKTYPDFVKLYPVMCELAKDEKCPIDMTQDYALILDGLYKLAKERSSDEAVRLATEEAKRKAEADAARESKSTVAGGGKTASHQELDARNMPLDQLEKQLGVISRDY